MNTSSWMANTLGHWATMSSILIWKISCDILSPKETRRNLYLLRWVLNIVRSEASSVRCIPKKVLLPSTLENLVAPVRTWATSLRVVALWFSWMIALFKSLGLRHILNLLFAFLGYVRLLTYGVGLVCLVMIPCQTISANSFLISLCTQWELSIFCAGTGGTVRSVLMSYSPCMSMMQSKAVGEQCLKIPGTVDGHWTWLHIDGIELWSWRRWTTGWLFCGWLCLLPWLKIWNDLTCLINRDHVLGVKVFNSIYNGLERSQFLAIFTNGLERSVFFRFILNGLERTLFMQFFWGLMAWDEPDLGLFLAHLVDGLERTLLPDFWWMVLKESLSGHLWPSCLSPWWFPKWSWKECTDDSDLLLWCLHGVLQSILSRWSSKEFLVLFFWCFHNS